MRDLWVVLFSVWNLVHELALSPAITRWEGTRYISLTQEYLVFAVDTDLN